MTFYTEFMPTPLVESKTLEAATAAAIANEAQHRATSAQTQQIVTETLEKFFAQQTEKERFISTQRVPFICQDIRGIKDDMKELIKMQNDFQTTLDAKLEERYVTKERLRPTEMVVYGFIGLSLTILIGAIIANVVGVRL